MAKETMASLQDKLDAVGRAYESFRTQVRDTAIEVAHEQGWCDEGLNQRLLDLGLEGVEREFQVNVSVWLAVKATHVGDAVSGKAGEVERALNSYGLDVYDATFVEVQEG